MHKSMTMFRLAGAATALALTSAVVQAQEAAPETTTPSNSQPEAEMAPDPRLAALSADQQAALKAWPAETQKYYFSLAEERQKIFWALADSDKVTLSRMPEAQAESTWAQIEARAKPQNL